MRKTARCSARSISAAFRSRASPTAKGTLYVVMQDPQGSVTVVDAKTMKATAHYPFGDKAAAATGSRWMRRTSVLFAACARSGNPPRSAKPQMVILSAIDGKILTTLPLAGASDGAVFNPGDDGGLQHAGQRHTDHRQGDEPDDIRGRAEPPDDELRADDRVRQQDGAHLHDGGRARTGAAAAAGRTRGTRCSDSGNVHDSDDREVAVATNHGDTRARRIILTSVFSVPPGLYLREARRRHRPRLSLTPSIARRGSTNAVGWPKFGLNEIVRGDSLLRPCH